MLLCLTATACSTAQTHTSRSYCDAQNSQTFISSPTVKVISLNAAHGRKNAFNQLFVSKQKTILNLEDIAQMLKANDADIVALQETDGPSFWSGNFDHVDFLRSSAQYGCSVHGYHIDSKYLNYGSAILSSAQTQSFQSVRFEPSPPTTRKGFVKTTIDWQPHNKVVPLTVVSVHLDFASKSVRSKQIATMIERLKNTNSPLIIMGDFNSHWQQRTSHVRMLSDLLSLEAFAPDSDVLSTFKHFKKRRYDWILISKDLEFVNYRNGHEDLSDHKSVFAEIAYKGTF